MGKVWMTGGGGADLDPTTAVPADVVYPKVYINKDGEPTTGTMTDRASVNEAISSGVVIGSQAYIRIPNGAYRTNTSVGSPEITLTGQRYTALLQQLTSDATSPANRIMSGYNAYVNGVKVAHKIVGRREGDIEKVWADPSYANNELGWKATETLEETLRSAWAWEQNLAKRASEA